MTEIVDMPRTETGNEPSTDACGVVAALAVVGVDSGVGVSEVAGGTADGVGVGCGLTEGRTSAVGKTVGSAVAAGGAEGLAGAVAAQATKSTAAPTTLNVRPTTPIAMARVIRPRRPDVDEKAANFRVSRLNDV